MVPQKQTNEIKVEDLQKTVNVPYEYNQKVKNYTTSNMKIGMKAIKKIHTESYDFLKVKRHTL